MDWDYPVNNKCQWLEENHKNNESDMWTVLPENIQCFPSKALISFSPFAHDISEKILKTGEFKMENLLINKSNSQVMTLTF